MSTHPNAMLLAVLTVDGTTRKTLRELEAEYGVESCGQFRFKVGGKDYTATVMEDDYDEGYQISAPEGSIVFHDFLTYGYGEVADWPAVVEQQRTLTEWLDQVVAKFGGSYSIKIGANYW